MKAADYIVDCLIQKGVTDVFGLPGDVVLDFLYAVDRRRGEIEAHLNYHEQSAAFAACGYAKVGGGLGVAYATRGPGITNMITGIADAYYDSTPVLFVTAHSNSGGLPGMRVYVDQEMDSVRLLSGITKYAARVEHAKDVCYEVERACRLAMTGRRGPVFLDFSTRVLAEEINMSESRLFSPLRNKRSVSEQDVRSLTGAMKSSKRPVLLIGDGIRQSGTMRHISSIAEKNRIPALSSRSSQDIMPNSEMYYGYIGSHAPRYSNFILSKADLIIALGNRMAFQPDSQTFGRVASNSKILRVDVDEAELLRDIHGSVSITADLEEFMPQLVCLDLSYTGSSEWISVCDELKKTLHDHDTAFPINIIAGILNTLGPDAIITSDTGNNELWLSRAHAYYGGSNRVLYPKSFEALGCSLSKAIGAHFATREHVVCFSGDQGFQMNIQELQFIASQNLPITIVLLNNASSGMIRSNQKRRFGSHFVHTTADSGYSVPDFANIAKAYGIGYHCFTEANAQKIYDIVARTLLPCIIELRINEEIGLTPHLPKGRPCQNFDPPLDRDIYERLDKL